MRARLYRETEEVRRRYGSYALATVALQLAALMAGALAYGTSQLPIYLSVTAASQYGMSLFYQSLSVALSFLALSTSTILTFLSRTSALRGEFPASMKLLHSSMALMAASLALSAAGLLSPASSMVGPSYYIYPAFLAAVTAVLALDRSVLAGVLRYYAPRRRLKA